MNLVFDWAGTLADDQELTWSLTNHVMQSFGHGPLTYSDYQREFTSSPERFYQKNCPGVSWALIESTFAEVCRSQYPSKAKLWPGVSAGLKCLACKHRLFLMSTLDQAMLEETLTRLDLNSLFEVVVGSAADKAQALPELLRTYQLAQDETVAIGDSPNDMRAAVAAGIEPIAVTYGYASAEALEAAGSEIAFSTWPDLLRNFDKLACAESRHFPVATVGGLIEDDGGNVLLVRTRKWSGLFGIPGGKIDYGETMEAAFIREAREETGLAIGALTFAMVQDCVEHPQFYRPRHFILVNFRARASGSKPPVNLNHESDTYIWVRPEQALAMALNDPTRILIERILGLNPDRE